VISDRYIDSTLAYQGAGRRTLDLADLEPIAWWAADHLVPDLTVLLDLERLQEGLATIQRVRPAGGRRRRLPRPHARLLPANWPERDPGRYLDPEGPRERSPRSRRRSADALAELLEAADRRGADASIARTSGAAAP
jgi:dTMP kinase